jgi:hypothetical protein
VEPKADKIPKGGQRYRYGAAVRIGRIKNSAAFHFLGRWPEKWPPPFDWLIDGRVSTGTLVI